MNKILERSSGEMIMTSGSILQPNIFGRLRLKCDGARAETHFEFRRNGRVHLIRRGLQFSRLLAAEVCASALVMLDTPCSEVVWRVLATHSVRQFPLHFPSFASPCAITFQLDFTSGRAIAGLSYGRFKTIRQKFNFQLPCKGPIVVCRKDWKQRSLGGIPG